MSILICSTKYGGCGFIGHGQCEFRGDGDYVFCPQCGEDHAFELTNENLDSLTNEKNRELARKLINNDKSVVAIARCGCYYHAEEGIACPHDVALARERFYAVVE